MTKATGKKRWGKARKKEEARARFSNLAGQFDISAPHREPNGRLARGPVEKPQKASIRARCIAAGWLPRRLDDGTLSHTPTADMAKRALAPHMGFTAGLALEAANLPRHELDRLWTAAQHLCAVDAAYRGIVGIPPRHPKAADLMAAPSGDPGGVVIGKPFDPRSEQERARSITNVWMGLKQILGMAGEGVLAEVEGVVLDNKAVSNRVKLLRGLVALAEAAT